MKCFQRKTLEIIGYQRDPGQATRVLMADKGRYVGAAVVHSSSTSGRNYGIRSKA
ncbi:hypothetical protein LB553_24300 [Mesorhizobium sp. CA8]|nr:hypothetical protein [Mesorhizobium sp. CA8]MBZ9822200.1 hypothetical protein [Mesorhizobium sp. CA4]